MTAPALLAVHDLEVRYGGVVALDRLHLEVAADAIVGLIGPNGAGKTTCIDAITGFTATSAGTITFDGRSIGGASPHRRAQAGLARTFQSLELFEDLTVRENLVVAAHTPTWRSTVTDVLWHKRHPSHEVDEWLEVLGLTPYADVSPTVLSNGQRHLVAIGRALAGRPKLVLLDEPAAGLDTDETTELADTIRRIRDHGIAVLLVDHDMGLVLEICDTVLVLDYGRCIAAGTPAEIRADPAVIEAYLGRQATTP